ncbi:MAG: HAD family hydrolase [Xenococcaceae cyanobacterium]
MLDPAILNRLKNIRLIATDMDGTLTTEGRFTAATIETLETLKEAGIIVLIVTGRSAGWVNAIFNYLPIEGAIAENGGIFYSNERKNREAIKFLTLIPDRYLHRQKLWKTFNFIKEKYPQIQESDDNTFRITDWTFDVEGLTILELKEMNDLCQQQGWSFTFSNVQCHIKPMGQEKANSLLQVLKENFPQLTTDRVVTVGDSPNDESLFDRNKFPISVGVANINHYLQYLQHQPIHITSKAEGEGFCELADLIMRSRVK